MSIAQVNESDWTQSSSSRSLNDVAKQLTFNISVEEFNRKINNVEQEILIPTPNGSFETFEIKPTNVVAPEVAHLYTIKTFVGYKKDNPSVKIACDISNGGFNAAVYEGDNTFFVEPAENELNEVAVFYKNSKESKRISCQALAHAQIHSHKAINSRSNNESKRILRLALTASGEFSERFGDNGYGYDKINVLNALAAGVNMINPIFSRDLGVEFSLVSDTSLVFVDDETDPFDPSNQSKMIRTNHSVIKQNIGVESFDIGHLVMWKAVGGLAYKSVVGLNSLKGAGFSGINTSLTTLWVDYVCHELGHQLGADHNFSVGGCNSVAGHRYEPGEGSSIMSYANVCSGAAGRYKTSSDPYFHYASIIQIQNVLNYVNPGIKVSEGNTAAPVADAGRDIVVPIGTPFVLVGNATDANDGMSNLTYEWQQFDGGSAETRGAPSCSSTDEAMFKYLPPSNENFRSFPCKEVLMGEENDTWEKLSCKPRTMTFSFAVRDNNSSFGRISHDLVTVRVAETGPFMLTAPNGNEELVADKEINVEWAVNGTDTHTPAIDILITTDGGGTFYMLAAATPNDGEQAVTIPSDLNGAGRLMIRASVNQTGQRGSGAMEYASLMNEAAVFYDMSDSEFTIVERSSSETSLPVEFVSFNAEVNGSFVDLIWKTASEIHNEGFEVERLNTELNEWDVIGFVNGKGATNDVTAYDFRDISPKAGENVYRLKQIDFDGQFDYSSVKSIRFEPQNLMHSFFPNPFTDVINTIAEVAPQQIRIFNAKGEKMFEVLNNTETQFDLSFLDTGMYFLEMVSADGSVSHQKLFKS